MTGPTPDPSVWLGQLEALDGQYRSLRRMVIYLAVFTMVLLLLLLGAILRIRGEQPKELILRDDHGKTRAWLGVAKGTPGLEFYDENGVVIAGLSMVKEQRGFLLFDENHKLRGLLGLIQGQPSLALYGDDGKQRANLTANQDGVGLVLRDNNEKPRAGLSVEKNQPRLSLLDEKGKEVSSKP